MLRLIDTNTECPISEGEILTSRNGDEYTVTGWAVPHKPSSTGRVYVEDDMGIACSYYPSVFNLEWREM